MVYGTIDEPVHAANLDEALARIGRAHPKAVVIAVDACLGAPENVGSITVSEGPLKPGAGVNKSLPAVGQIAVTGVVNVAGFMEYFVLQNTRLSLVMSMARVIARAIFESVAAEAPQPVCSAGEAAGTAGRAQAAAREGGCGYRRSVGACERSVAATQASST
jgi:putative sporulation protein YyaC